MAEIPTLSTRRLDIVPFDETFLTERYVAWLNDPEVVRYSEQRHRRHTLDSCRRYWRGIAAGEDCLSAVVVRDPDLGHVGNVGVSVDRPNRVADVAMLIGEKRAWRRGVGLEAWTAVMEELLGNQGMRKVTAGTMAANEPMLRVMHASGMVEEGRRRGQFLLDGQAVDLVYAAAWARDAGAPPEARA